MVKTRLNIHQIPRDFWWGAAASAPQTEGMSLGGGKSLNTWDWWYANNPEKFDQNIGPSDTSEVTKYYKQDIQLMQDMKMNSYRTSISWSRLLPDGRTINQEAVAFYRDYFKTLKDKGIEPIVNLFHFDMPMWMMEKDGWLNRDIVDAFAYYAKQCVTHFGDIVEYWTTFNEPVVHVECSYLYGYHYPAIHDFKKAVLAAYHTILAHAKAIQAMRAGHPKGQFGTILNLSPVYAASSSEEDQKAGKIADLLNNKSFLDGMVEGHFDAELLELLTEHELMPDYEKDDIAVIKATKLDFLGVNYYQPRRVQAPQEVMTPAQDPKDFYIPYEWEERRINPYRGWEIYPEGLHDIAQRLLHNYNNIPWFLSENGIGVAEENRFKDESGMIQDTYRIEFIEDHLEILLQEIQKGSACFGYHMWTFVDCWSWLNGYRNRYGFIEMDLESKKRTRKLSSYWFESLIEASQEPSHILAIDVGGTSIKYAMWSDGLQSVHSIETPQTWKAFLETVQTIKDSYEKVDGIALSMPGSVNVETGIIGGLSAVPYIHHFPIQKELETCFQCPVSIENDANCATYAEIWQGQAKDVENAILLVIGTGIGGAVILDGNIIKGAHIYGGEFGCMLMPNGETFSRAATAVNMASKYNEEHQTQKTGKEIFALSDAGDVNAAKAVNTMLDNLAMGIYNLMFTTNPSRIILGGAISTRPQLIDEINQRIHRYLEQAEIVGLETELVPCAFTENANLVGAVFHYEKEVQR